MHGRGDLRIAVLVNEVGAVDLDSQLVNLKQVRSSWSSRVSRSFGKRHAEHVA